MKKEFNLKEEKQKWASKWLHKKLTGRAYKELRDIENEFIKRLKESFKIWNFDWVKSLKRKEFEKGVNEIIDKHAGEKLI